MLHRRVVLIIGVVLVGALGTRAHAQSISLSLDGVPLREALAAVRQQTHFDLVYAERLIRDRVATCTYVGDDRQAALRCVLEGTGLTAERIRRGQYVLAAVTAEEHTGGASRSEPSRNALAGYVRDAQTGETLPGAHVTLMDLQAGTTTNRTGYFVFSALPPGPYDVRISYLGFETVDTTLVAGREPVTIDLTSTTLASKEVLVRADSSNGKASRRPPGMMSVALDRIEQLPSLGEPDLFKALQWTPGIRKSGVISGGLSVRGADPDQNLYLLDKAPVYHPWHAFSLISTFQTGTLRNTNLYRGSFPAELGGRLSSVLDAQMKDGNRAEPKAIAGISVLSGRFRIEAPLSDKTSFMVSGRRSYIDKLIGRTHPVTDASGRRDTLRTGYYFYDTSAKVTHRFQPGHRLSVSYYRGRDDLDLRLPFDLSLDFSSWLRPADLFFEVEQGWENQIVSAQHQILLSDDVFLTTTGYYSGYRAEEKSFIQPTTTASLRSDYNVELDDVGLKMNVDYHHSVAHQMQAGIQVKSLRFESTLDSRLKRSSGTIDTLSQQSPLDALRAVAYAQDVWNPTPKWSIQPGLRLSYFSGGDHVHLRPRLSVRYTLHPQFAVLRAAAGMHVQYLHRLRDRYSLAYDLVTSRWVPSTSSIRPASGTQVGAGIRSQPWPGLTLELNAYSRWTRNLLVPADVFREKEGFEGPGIEVGALRGQFTRADERAFGTELTALLERGLWDVRFGIATGRTFVRAPERSGNRWRPADLDVPLSVRSAVSWTGDPWEATLASEIRSGYPISVPVARYRLGDPVEGPTAFLYRPQINNGRLPMYVRLDASLGYRFGFLSARWTAKLTLFNVSNRRNVVDRTYLPTQSGVSVNDQTGLPVLPLFEIEMEL